MNEKYNIDYVDVILGNLKNTVHTATNEFNVFNNCLIKQKPVLETYGIKIADTITDKNHKYRKNNFGFRDNIFENVSDLVFAGCSHSYGIGIPEELIWGNQIANRLNLKSANISTPGAGVDYIINTVYAYFKEFGSPKILLCLFPNFTRIEMPINLNKITHSNMSHNINEITLALDMIDFRDNIQTDKIMKIPYDIEKILGQDFLYMIAIKKILILEQYCEAVGIKFFWGTWDKKANKVCKILQKRYNTFLNFIDVLEEKTYCINNSINAHKYVEKIDVYKYENLNEKDQDIMFEKLINYCHKDIEEQYSHCFEVGQDDISEINPHAVRHYGVHKHVHFAENFVNMI